MRKLKLIHQFRDELRTWILYEERIASGTGATMPVGDLLARQQEVLIAIYCALAEVTGLPPTPDMLRQMGWAGALIHTVCCETSGVWPAFRKNVARRHPDLPSVTPLVENGVRLHSLAERLVLRALNGLSGIASIAVHPFLPNNSSKQADFLVTAMSGKKAYLEVAMSGFDASTDSQFLAAYRNRLINKLATYQAQGLAPVVIWADELVPSVLAVRINEVLERLDLPARPVPARAWFEAGLEGETA